MAVCGRELAQEVCNSVSGVSDFIPHLDLACRTAAVKTDHDSCRAGGEAVSHNEGPDSAFFPDSFLITHIERFSGCRQIAVMLRGVWRNMHSILFRNMAQDDLAGSGVLLLSVDEKGEILPTCLQSKVCAVGQFLRQCRKIRKVLKMPEKFLIFAGSVCKIR